MAGRESSRKSAEDLDNSGPKQEGVYRHASCRSGTILLVDYSALAQGLGVAFFHSTITDS